MKLIQTGKLLTPAIATVLLAVLLNVPAGFLLPVHADDSDSDSEYGLENSSAECREAVHAAQRDLASCLAPVGLKLISSTELPPRTDPLRRADRCQDRHAEALDEIHARYVSGGGVAADDCGLEVEQADTLQRVTGSLIKRLRRFLRGDAPPKARAIVTLRVAEVTDPLMSEPAVLSAYPNAKTFIDSASSPSHSALTGTAATEACSCTMDGWCTDPSSQGGLLCIDESYCVGPRLAPGVGECTIVALPLVTPFCSSSSGDPAAFIEAHISPQFCVPDYASTCRTLPFYIFPPVPDSPVPATGDTMNANEVLAPWITSSDGRFTFVYQSDGNLVLYRNGSTDALWASGTNGTSEGLTLMQENGNLVIYDATNLPVFDTGTSGNPGSRLIVQNDGNVVIYSPDGRPLWATNTVQP